MADGAPTSLEIPIPEGGTITAAYASTTVVTVAVVYPLDDYLRLIAFFDAVLEGWDRTSESGPDTTRCEYWSGSDTVVVTVCVDTETAGFEVDAACVAITQARRTG